MVTTMGPAGAEPPTEPEGDFLLSALVSQLVVQSQEGFQAALVRQIEAATRELEVLRQLSDDLFAGFYVPFEEVVEEVRALFPPPPGTDHLTGVSVGVPYTAAAPDKGQQEQQEKALPRALQQEDPPLKALLGYDVKPGDVQNNVITQQGERNVLEHVWRTRGVARRTALRELHQRGVPYLLVDHGSLNVKLSFRLVAQPPATIPSGYLLALLRQLRIRPIRAPVPGSLTSLRARLVNEKNIEALGRDKGAVGELDISFKADLR
jgi:hypothetical protein